MSGKLSKVEKFITEQAAAFSEATKVPGYLAGVYHEGEQIVVAHGTANLATKAPMQADTGFLFGSVTKLLTTTLILQQVEQGKIKLDDPLVKYLPDFKLKGAPVDKIRVRNLLNHTNGIDADLFFLDASGPQAIKAFVEGLGENCGALFAPGQYVSYSNGGMITAGRLLEVVTGRPYHDLLKEKIYKPVGMKDASTSAEEAILRSTAVGHFPDMATQAVRRTDMFMLPQSWAPAGSTPVGSIGDLLAFGRTHIAKGISPTGAKVLSTKSVELMQTVSYDMKTPNIPPMGYGWVIMPFGKTTVFSHSGASPGGVAVLTVVPEHDLVFAAFGNDGRAMKLHDQLMLWILEEHLGIEVPELVTEEIDVPDLAPYEGTYRSNQMRIDVKAVDGQLEEQMSYEPLNDSQKEIFTKFSGGSLASIPPRRFVPVGKDLFAPAGMPLQAFKGYSRSLLTSYHGLEGGKATHRSAGGRMTRRA